MSSEKGQSMMELVVVVAVAVVVISALVFATIASLRNASFAKNQLQATKLAQQGLEKIRGLRDQDGNIRDNEVDTAFSEFQCSDTNNCFFFFSAGILTSGTVTNFEPIPPPPAPPDFKRQFQIINEGSDPKKVTVVVKWTDFSGSHESRLTTILRNTK